MKWHNHKLTSNQVGLKYGFRSGLEIAISKELDLNKVKYEFETIKLKYTVPEKVHTYTPDFYLKENNGILKSNFSRNFNTVHFWDYKNIKIPYLKYRNFGIILQN